MKKIIILSTLALAICSVSSFAKEQTKNTYGTPFVENKAKIITPARLDAVMGDEEKLDDVVMQGYINEVCQKAGCWIRLSSTQDSKEEIMVKMKDHAFLLPKDISGKQAVIKGYVVKKEVSVKEQQHYLEDAGASAAEIAKITTPKVSYQMIATGIVIK